MKCVKCKKEISNEDLFCGYCGINQKDFSSYISKVEQTIRSERDYKYDIAVKNAQGNLENLEQLRIDEIHRISEERWNSIGNNFSYNMIEGKVIINGNSYVFSDIKGAEIRTQDSYRVVTNDYSKSQKHVSLGKALVGGALLGPIGAIAGGAMGKTSTHGKLIENSIPTCNHIGVSVSINGFGTEIVVLNKTVDQSSSAYNSSISEAQSIVDMLRKLSTTPVPKKYLKPEEEQSVLNYDSQIKEAKILLQDVINNKPTYEIPKSYYE